MILGILLIVSGTFFFLKITQVKVEGGDIYSDQQIIASAMSDKYAYHTLYFLAKSKLGHVDCLPFVQEIDVEWNSPTGIVLHVYDKTSAAASNIWGSTFILIRTELCFRA